MASVQVGGLGALENLKASAHEVASLADTESRSCDWLPRPVPKAIGYTREVGETALFLHQTCPLHSLPVPCP